MKAALYARVSTEEQAERFGLAAQLHELRLAAVQKGYVVPAGAEYIDDGHSGADLDRPALTRLREAVRAGAYAVVLAHDPDRLSRRLPHQLLLLEELERGGARVEFVTTPREKTPEGQLLLNVKGVIAEYERAKIVERTIRGKREKARRGLIVASFPYGYRPDPSAPGRLVVFEPEASVVRMIYSWLIDEGRSTRSIVSELRRLGVPPARLGRSWGMTQVRRILMSDRYTGRTFYNRDQVVAGGRRKIRPSSDWIEVAIPAIVTPERYSAARAQLAANRARLVGRPARFVYLLRGLLRCVICGSKYESCPSHGHRYYRCQGRDRLSAGPRCQAPWLPAEFAEKAIWEAIATALRRPEILRRGVEHHAMGRSTRDVELRSRVEHLRSRLQTVAQREQRLLDLYVEEHVQVEQVSARLRQLASARQTLAGDLQRAEAQAASLGASQSRQEALEQWCAQARRGLSRLDQAGRRKLLEAVVDEIRVGADRSLQIYGILPPSSDAQELRRPA